MQILQTDYEILKACHRQLQNFLPWGCALTWNSVHRPHWFWISFCVLVHRLFGESSLKFQIAPLYNIDIECKIWTFCCNLLFELCWTLLKSVSLLNIENNSSWVNFTHFREKTHFLTLKMIFISLSWRVYMYIKFDI